MCPLCNDEEHQHWECAEEAIGDIYHCTVCGCRYRKSFQGETKILVDPSREGQAPATQLP